jgi:hypothetical protein
MKAVLAAVGLSALLVGCSHERTPYSAADETSNPPRAEAVFTNTPVTPTSDRTNSRVYVTDQTNAAGARR